MGMNIVLIGRMRTGKTTEAKRIAVALGFPLIVNDENREWGQQPLDVKHFLSLADKHHGRPTTFVWEEATGYLTNVGGSSEDFRRVTRALVRRFHTRHVNLLLFHSIRAVPVWVMDYADRLILFPTSDRPSLVEQRYKGHPVLDAFHEVNDPNREIVAVSPRVDIIRKPVDIPIFGA